MRMDFLDQMRRVIDYLEDNLTGDIDYRAIGHIVCSSYYQFGRVFSVVTGITMGEYVRRRRLTLAALDLQAGGDRVIDVALRYGYASPDAFTRAFAQLHGVTPRQAATQGAVLTLQPRITFHISVGGTRHMEYRLETIPEGTVCAGIHRNFGAWKPDEDAADWKAKQGETWDYWNAFLDDGENLILRDKYRLYRPPFYQVGMTQTLENGDTVVSIGAQAREGETYPS